MALSAGTRLGVYEIVASLGAGGMGEVYRARDTRLARDVAIKVLPPDVAAEPERLARFEREAQVLASLNHPNIAHIHGVEDSTGTPALIMELVEGPTLADRVAKGPIPLEEALPIAKQIAEGLEAAHEQGIIHRDLKPANIKVRDDGAVKILDFGLAKAFEPKQPAAVNTTQSPTITTPAMMTGVGVILGTAAYMSPEQAKGRPADKRSDVWAFGCVLYEMLTGKRAFDGEDVSDTLAAVLRAEPDWNAFGRDVPDHVRTIVSQCVARDRAARIPDIAVVRFALDNPVRPASSNAEVTAVIRQRSAWPWKVATALLVLTTIAAAGAWYIARSAPRPIARFAVVPPDNGMFASGLANRLGAFAAVSPDGSKVALTVRDSTEKVRLWIRPIDSLTAQPLAGTDGAAYPFWSPDSRFIGYAIAGRLMKIAASGGPPQTVCAFSGPTILGRGAAWGRDGGIVFNNGPGPLFRVSSGGGQPTAIGTLPVGVQSFNFPAFLPDGTHVIAFAQLPSAAFGSSDQGALYAVSLPSGDSKQIGTADSGAVFSPREKLLLFVRQGALLAQPFDPATLELYGDSTNVADRVETSVTPGFSAFSLSTTGTLAYGMSVTGGAAVQLDWVDRGGKLLQTAAPLANYRGIELSHDGLRIAAHHHDGTMQGDLWITELARGTTLRFTHDTRENSSPVWSPDGKFLAFGSVREGKWGLYRKPTDNAGVEERLLGSDDTVLPESWSPDGQAIVFTRFSTRAPDLWMLPLTGDRKPIALLNGPYIETSGQVSPDGKWLAYDSNETGTTEVYVQPFPSGAGKWRVSTNGGNFPRWRQDGRELFYLDPRRSRTLMAVDVHSAGPTFDASAPRELFDSGIVNLNHNGPYLPYAVSPDGQRFLIARTPPGAGPATAPVVVVTNWAADLQK